MRRTQRWSGISMVLGLVCAVILFGCDGNGDGGNDGNADLENAREAARDTINTSIQVFVDGATQLLATAGETPQDQEPFAVTVACTESGEATLTGVLTTTGTATAGSFEFEDVAATYTACNAFSGTLTFAMEGTFQQNLVSFTMTLDGAVANACTMDIENVTVEGATNTSTETVTGTTSGSLDATCNGTTVSCTWQGVDINNAAALEAACHEQ